MENLLKLGSGNAKLENDVAIFDLPASFTCPFAKDCAEGESTAVNKAE